MSIECKIREMDTSLIHGSADFFAGVDFAKHRAEQIAKEADELIRRMGNVIAAIEPTDLPDELNGRVRSALNSYNNWKETTK